LAATAFGLTSARSVPLQDGGVMRESKMHIEPMVVKVEELVSS
jgi:hypothetical protein